MKFLATLALMVAVAGCGILGDDPKPPPQPPNPLPTPVTLTLTAQSATASAQMPRITAARGLRITTSALTNPKAQGLLIEVSLTSPQGRVARLGTFSPYPADRPGSSSHLPLTADGAAIAAEPATLTMQLSALPEGTQIDPSLAISLMVTLTSE